MLVRCPESRRSARGRLLLCTYIVISIRAIASVLYREVVLWWEGPLWEVPLYSLLLDQSRYQQLVYIAITTLQIRRLLLDDVESANVYMHSKMLHLLVLLVKQPNLEDFHTFSLGHPSEVKLRYLLYNNNNNQ